MAALPPIVLRVPSIYQSSPPVSAAEQPERPSFPPPLSFLHRTWNVVHSTLPMWRHSRNVRITYTALSDASGGCSRISDLVENDPVDPTRRAKNSRRILGIDTASGPGDTTSWNWRGKGLLFWVRSHWEVLGWGERQPGHDSPDGPDGSDNPDVADASASSNTSPVERWAVTWFQKTLFSDEGLDIYCDRDEGLSSETLKLIMDALKASPAVAVAKLANGMEPVAR